MTHPEPEKLVIRVDQARTVSGLLQVPTGAVACFVLAHGAGTKQATVHGGGLGRTGRMAHCQLALPVPVYGGRIQPPDSPRLALATVRAATAQASSMVPDLPLIAGGKSFGGRMTAQAQAEIPLPGVRGLAFLGFPLHPTKKPSATRAEHRFQITVPMLFLQGDRDQLAEPSLLHQLLEILGPRATLNLFPDADHSFHVPIRSGRTDEQVMDTMMDVLVAWIMKVLAPAE